MKKIDLSRKNLDLFPSSVLIDDDVEIIDLSFNNISDIPTEITKLKKLKILFLTSNCFETIPKCLFETNIEMLSFKQNKIKTINEKSLPISLKWLMLTDNFIEKLPNDFGNLINIRKLACSGNQLCDLPSSIINCKELELIRFSNNKIKNMPTFIFDLPKLCYIGLGENPCIDTYENKCTNIDENNIKFLNVLGKGASGVVYKGVYENNFVAVKKFHDYGSSDGIYETEINIHSNLENHNNIINFVGKTNNILVLEYINDCSVLGLVPSFDTITRDIININLNEEQIKFIVKNICRAMCYLSEKQIVHGDLYAHNILFSENIVKLGDFGASFHIKNKDIYKKIELCEVRSFGYLIEDLVKNQNIKSFDEIINKCFDKKYSFLEILNYINWN